MPHTHGAGTGPTALQPLGVVATAFGKGEVLGPDLHAPSPMALLRDAPLATLPTPPLGPPDAPLPPARAARRGPWEGERLVRVPGLLPGRPSPSSRCMTPGQTAQHSPVHQGRGQDVLATLGKHFVPWPGGELNTRACLGWMAPLWGPGGSSAGRSSTGVSPD